MQWVFGVEQEQVRKREACEANSIDHGQFLRKERGAKDM
jgi:hypothetical protein